VDAETAESLWAFEKTNRWAVHPNTPLYHDGYLFCVSGYGSGNVMLKLSEDGSQVEEVWRNTNLDNQMGGVILLDGKLYGGGQNSKKWYCLDWKTGEELFETNAIARGNTIFADDLLYFYDERGTVNLVEPNGANTKVISSFKVPYGSAQHWAHLVISNKILYVRHGNSLMVYSIGG
jgi:outer membrane protein assembly factor BamB